MDNNKAWIVEDAAGNTTVCSSEGAAYRQALHYYIDFLTEDFAEIRKGSGVDNMDVVEHVYKTIICNLKTLAQNHYIEDTVDIREVRFVDWE